MDAGRARREGDVEAAVDEERHGWPEGLPRLDGPGDAVAVGRVLLAQLDGEGRRAGERPEDLAEARVADRGAVRHVERLHGAFGGAGASPFSERERTRRSATPAARWTSPTPETNPRKNPEPKNPGRARGRSTDGGTGTRQPPCSRRRRGRCRENREGGALGAFYDAQKALVEELNAKKPRPKARCKRRKPQKSVSAWPAVTVRAVRSGGSRSWAPSAKARRAPTAVGPPAAEPERDRRNATEEAPDAARSRGTAARCRAARAARRSPAGCRSRAGAARRRGCASPNRGTAPAARSRRAGRDSEERRLGTAPSITRRAGGTSDRERQLCVPRWTCSWGAGPWGAGRLLSRQASARAWLELVGRASRTSGARAAPPLDSAGR